MTRKNISKGPQPFFDLLEKINENWVREDRAFGVPRVADLSITGQPYAELAANTPHPDRSEALALGRGLFESYARNRPGILYWHTSPTIERISYDEGGYGYRVRMKLLISDNPIVPRLAAEALREDAECM